MSVLWRMCLALMLVPYCSFSTENEVPLHTTTWLSEGKNTLVHLSRGHTRRFHFILRKKTTALMLTVSPCSGRIEWSLTATTLKDKPAKDQYWSFKKSEPEVWWRKSAGEKTLHTYAGNTVDTYQGPALHLVSVYSLRIKSTQEDTHAQVYVHKGPALWGLFPELPFDYRVHLLGVGMSSVTLTWSPSPSVTEAPHTHTNKRLYEHCVTINRKHNYRSLCAAQEEKGEMKVKLKKKTMVKLDRFDKLVCVCKDVENVCTIADLLPNTLYYFDVFVIDRINGTSAAYTGAVARTHAESHASAELRVHTEPYREPWTHSVSSLREGQVQWLTLRSGADEKRSFSFRPRGGQRNGLLTLLSCNNTHTLSHTLYVSVSARGNELTSQKVEDKLIQIWLQGFSSYLIQLQLSARNTHAAEKEETVCVKMQAASAFHRRGAPALPHTLTIKSFNTLRTCTSVTLAWMGTEERGLYCLYRRRADEQSERSGDGVIQVIQRSEPDRDGVIHHGQMSESGGDRVTRGGRRCKTGQTRVVWHGLKGETGGERKVSCEKKSETGKNRVMPHEQKSDTDPCLAPESRPPDQRVLCKYFQELDARRAVTTETVGGLEAGTLYTFDVYLMRRWAIPLKYNSKTVRTRRDC
ncbi:protein NDNF [Clarias gariepinus]|uniref:protein NDNF n=1 Tax=Clarias gariepinus TaxID=13013 RepID=UPI00234C8B2E|nr:protein NDNF [Clarias gariepinus]